MLILILVIALMAFVLYYKAISKESQDANEIGGNIIAPITLTAKTLTANDVRTANFKLSEMDCKDGTPVPSGFYLNVLTLFQNLQIIRDTLGVPILINSGYRTQSHNKKIGGVNDSLHLQAAAADIVAVGIPASVVQQTIEKLIAEKRIHAGGLGYYKNFTHYDLGNFRSWQG